MKRRIFSAFIVMIIAATMVGSTYQWNRNKGQIYLYGEFHANPDIMDIEFETWNKYYHEQGMRHLFVEFPYYFTEFLNLWMQSESDEVLDELWKEIKGTYGGADIVKDFFKRIKEECPKTIFHGTDVGHQYDTIGQQYLTYLEKHKQKDSLNYKRAQEIIEQGKRYQGEGSQDEVYRENMMAENFIWEFKQLKNENIMGIYGGAHAKIGEKDYSTGTVSNMATQISEKYKGKVYSTDLTIGRDILVPIEEAFLEINGKIYPAYLWREVRMSIENKPYNYAKVWELKEKTEDFKEIPVGEETLPSSVYPCEVKYGKIYVFDFYAGDEFGERRLFLSDGQMMDDGTIMTRELLFQ